MPHAHGSLGRDSPRAGFAGMDRPAAPGAGRRRGAWTHGAAEPDPTPYAAGCRMVAVPAEKNQRGVASCATPPVTHDSTRALVLRRIGRHHRRGVRTTHSRAVGHHRRLGGRRRGLLRLLATARREGREGKRHQRQSKKLTHRVHVHLLSRCRPVDHLGRPCSSVSKSTTQKKTPLSASGVGRHDPRVVSKDVCGPCRRTFFAAPACKSDPQARDRPSACQLDAPRRRVLNDRGSRCAIACCETHVTGHQPRASGVRSASASLQGSRGAVGAPAADREARANDRAPC